MSERKIHIYESDHSYFLRITPPAALERLMHVSNMFAGHYRYANAGGWLFGHVVLDTDETQVLGFDKDHVHGSAITIETCAHIIAEPINAKVASYGPREALALDKLEAEFGCKSRL